MRHPLRTGLPATASPADSWDALRRPPRHNDEALTGTTRAWLRKLPPGRRPQLLCMQFPRLANRIAWHWSDPAQSHAVLTELLEDRRGGRSGFPSSVVHELRRLIEYQTRMTETAQATGYLELLRRFWPRH